MTFGGRAKSWFSRTGSELLGWTLAIAGILLMPLPGPGTVVLVAGVALLARHYDWARRMLEPLRRKAVEAAIYGVATRKRILLSFLGGLWVFAAGILWLVGPTIPVMDFGDITFGPRLPFGGWVLGTLLVTIGLGTWYVMEKVIGAHPLSILPGLFLVTGGTLWAWNPRIGTHVVRLGVGPELPAAGVYTGISLMVSALAAWAVLAYCVRKYRGHSLQDELFPAE